jgi:RNA polymerase sigma factor (sigma-70 family)
MYGTAVRDEPTAAELEAAQLGFAQMLRRKRFSARFIEAHAEDLLARARFEYSRAAARGDEIRSPAGWLIHCAWRRTQNLLEAQSGEPTFVAEDAVGVIADEASPTPEQATIEADRAERVAAAVAELSADQRTLIELSYFEGMSVREAGRFLGWHSSKAQRTHEAALRRLRELLGISDVDELAIEIGLAAWVSLAAAKPVLASIPAGIEAAAEAGGQAASGIWARAQELARRALLGGGESSSAMAAGGVARTAGVCGAAAVACLAGGVVGPGVGGVGLIGGGHHAQSRAKPEAVISRRVDPTYNYAAENATAAGEPAAKAAGKFASDSPEPKPEPEPTPQPKSPAQRAKAEFSPFTSGGESGGGGGESAPEAPPVARGAGVALGSGGGGGSAAGSGSAAKEFGAFR